MKKIFVYDDEGDVVAQYVRKLQSLSVITDKFHVDSFPSEDFEKDLDALSKRRKAWYEGGQPDLDSLTIDETSILVIDFVIWSAFKSKVFLTGEEVAYNVRCFSKCGIIVGMNRYPGKNAFDLTLKGHPDSYADLNIWSEQLDNPGLWGLNSNGFRPWCWPQLPEFLDSFETKVVEVAEKLDSPICEVLGLGERIKKLPRSIKAFIGGDPLKMKIREFVHESEGGLRHKERVESDQFIARIAVARLSKWMERMVLPCQDLLIDAPHLVSRCPSLLDGDHSRVDTWDRTAALGRNEDLGLKNSLIEDFKFKNDIWLSRPAWFWRELSESPNIKEVNSPWEKEATDFVFCEDTSRFHPRDNCTEFVSEVDSPYIRRYARKLSYVSYLPHENMILTKL